MIRSLSLYLLFVLLIAIIPASIQRTDEAVTLRPPELGNRVLDRYVRTDLGEAVAGDENIEKPQEWTQGISEILDTYAIGSTERRISRTLPRYFLWSSGALLLGLTVAFVLGLLLLVLLVQGERYRLLDRMQQIAVMPTFIVVIALQQLVLALNGALGTQIRIAAGREPAILLPIIALSLIPGAFLMRSLASAVTDESLATALWAAKSRGVPRGSLVRRHFLAAGLEAVHRSRNGLFTYLFANLLIVEQLCNLPGVTRALFGYGFVNRSVRYATGDGGYGEFARIYQVQINLVVFGLIALALAYVLVRGLFRLLMLGSRRYLLGEQ